MPTTMTLEGARTSKLVNFLRNISPRRRPLLGDAWSDDVAAQAGTNAIADFTTSALGWGILAFAAGTAAIRATRAVKRVLP